MQIKTHTSRDGATSWNLIRWEWSAEKKRAVSRSLGTLKDFILELGPEPTAEILKICGVDLEEFTPTEKEELFQFWAHAREPMLAERVRGTIEKIEASLKGLSNVLWEVGKIDGRRPDPVAVQERLKSILSTDQAVNLSDALANGHQLLEACGYPSRGALACERDM